LAGKSGSDDSTGRGGSGTCGLILLFLHPGARQFRSPEGLTDPNQETLTSLHEFAWPAAHPSDEELERYCLGKITEEHLLESLEEHLLTCSACVLRAEQTQEYVDTVRAGLAAYMKGSA